MKNDLHAPNPFLLRTGSVAAVAGVGGGLVAFAVEPSMPDDPEVGIRIAATNGWFEFSRLLDLIAILLVLVGIAIATQTFRSEPARSCARAGLTVLTAAIAAGAIAITVMGGLTDVADAWADAPIDRKAAYVATFDALVDTGYAVSFAAFIGIALFGLLYAAAIATEGLAPRWLAWVSRASAACFGVSFVLAIGFDADIEFLFLVIGLLLFYLVVIGLAVRMWRLAGGAPWSPHAIEHRSTHDIDPLALRSETTTRRS